MKTVWFAQTISNYRILKKLGAGGMGEVYLVTKALRKDRDERYQTVKDFVTD